MGWQKEQGCNCVRHPPAINLGFINIRKVTAFVGAADAASCFNRVDRPYATVVSRKKGMSSNICKCASLVVKIWSTVSKPVLDPPKGRARKKTAIRSCQASHRGLHTSCWYLLLLGPVLGACTTACDDKTKSKSCAKYAGPARRLANSQR